MLIILKYRDVDVNREFSFVNGVSYIIAEVSAGSGG